MNAGKDTESASPDLPDEAYEEALENRYARAMQFYEHVKRQSSLGASQPVLQHSEGESDLSQELHQLGICLHSRSNSKDSQVSGKTSFSLKDISNSRDFARAHRRTSSKLLRFEDSENSVRASETQACYKSSMLVKSVTQSYSNILGSVQRSADDRDSKEGSLALISEYPSSVYEEVGRTDTSRSVPYAIDIDLRSPTEVREGSTILSNLSSDSSRVGYTVGSDSEEQRGSVAYVSATSIPMSREPLEINLFESQTADRGDFRCSVNSSRLPPARKVFCPTCQSEVVPILSFQPTEVSWWKRVFMLGEFIRCCHEARPQHEDVVHICRKCARELYRSKAR